MYAHLNDDLRHICEHERDVENTDLETFNLLSAAGTAVKGEMHAAANEDSVTTQQDCQISLAAFWQFSFGAALHDGGIVVDPCLVNVVLHRASTLHQGQHGVQLPEKRTLWSALITKSNEQRTRNSTGKQSPRPRTN